jgi:hypothetical protein
MSTRDEDILDFDFFEEEDAPAWEEPEGSEAVPSTERARRGGGGSRFGGSRNLTPLLRLIGLIALAILVVVLLVVWVEGCTADAKRDRNETYLAEIGAIGNASARLGQQVSTLLTTPGLNQEDLDAKLGGYAQTADNQVQRAEDLDPPGPMVGPNTGAVESLRYRANGLRGLQTAFKDTVDTDMSARQSAGVLSMLKRVPDNELQTRSLADAAVSCSTCTASIQLLDPDQVATIIGEVYGDAEIGALAAQLLVAAGVTP